MKLSDKPTEYIIVKAYTNSEWDGVDAVVVHIGDEKWQKAQLKRMVAAEQFKGDYSFYCIEFHGSPDKWVYDIPEECELDELEWSFLDITEEELEELSAPSNKLKYGNIRAFHDGIQFVVYGEYTGEEFWCSEIPLKTILEKYNEVASV